MKNETIHICIAADQNYKLPLTALLNSAIKNMTHECVLHILCSGLSAKFQDKLKLACKDTPISIDFRDMSKFEFDFHGLDMQHWTKAIFYRIMIPEMFKDYDRMIYLDGDTLIMGDLYDLFHTDFSDDNMLAMVVDRFSYRARIPELHLKNYFNSGMILFDIKKCLEYDFAHKCIQWIHDNPEQAKFPDQDAINIICDGKILRLNNMYNKQFATNDFIDWDAKTPVIAHFLSAIKPWSKNAPLGYSKKYRSYIPNICSRFMVFVKQFLYATKYFCFHKQYAMKLKNMKVIEQVKSYVFNICVYTRTLNNQKPNLIDILQNNKDAKKCI